MIKPNEVELKLYEFGTIQGIKVDYRQTGTETAETYVELYSSKNTIKGLWKTYRDFLSVDVGHSSVARLKGSSSNKCKKWLEFVEDNKLELAEYERLKKKFTQLPEPPK